MITATKGAGLESFLSRIKQLKKDGRFTDEVKLLLLGELGEAARSERIRGSEVFDVEEAIGKEFIEAKQAAIDLATFGCREDEI